MKVYECGKSEILMSRLRFSVHFFFYSHFLLKYGSLVQKVLLHAVDGTVYLITSLCLFQEKAGIGESQCSVGWNHVTVIRKSKTVISLVLCITLFR